VDHDDVRDLNGRLWRVLLAIVLGLASMFGIAVGVGQLARYFGHGEPFANLLDLGTLVGLTVVLVAGWSAALHWFSHRNDRRMRALSMSARAWVIRRNRARS
jgi:hypothetical protein